MAVNHELQRALCMHGKLKSEALRLLQLLSRTRHCLPLSVQVLPAHKSLARSVCTVPGPIGLGILGQGAILGPPMGGFSSQRLHDCGLLKIQFTCVFGQARCAST